MSTERFRGFLCATHPVVIVLPASICHWKPPCCRIVAWAQSVEAKRAVRGPGRKHRTPVSGWEQQLMSRIGVSDHACQASLIALGGFSGAEGAG